MICSEIVSIFLGNLLLLDFVVNIVRLDTLTVVLVLLGESPRLLLVLFLVRQLVVKQRLNDILVRVVQRLQSVQRILKAGLLDLDLAQKLVQLVVSEPSIIRLLPTVFKQIC